MQKIRSIVVLGLLTSLAACSSDFEPSTRLMRPRLLAIQAEPVNPTVGQSTLLRPMVYLPTGAVATYQWSWCPVPTDADSGYLCPVTQAMLDSIAAQAGLVDVPPLDLGTGETVTFTNPFPPTLLAALCASDPAVLALFTSSASGAPIFTCDEATLSMQVKLTIGGTDSDAGVIALRLPTDTTTPGNQNPVLTGIDVTEPAPQRPLDQLASISVPRDFDVKLLAQLDPSQSEAYQGWQELENGEYQTDDNGQRVLGASSERLTFSWFSEVGDFDDAITRWDAQSLDTTGQPFPFEESLQNTWKTPKLEDFAGATSRLILVVRDGRGGVNWTQAAVTLEGVQ